MKRILIIPSVLILILALVPFVSEAQEEGTIVSSEPQQELGEIEHQRVLAEIGRKLEEVEREVNRLSLIVNIFALQQQALALQERLSSRIAATNVQEPPVIGGDVVAITQETTGEIPVTEEGESASTAIEEEEPEDIFSVVTLEEEPSALKDLGVSERRDEEGSNRGFFAALGPLGNLGTPELAALAILAILAVFIVVRRLRGRRKSSLRSVPIQPSQGSQAQQDLLQEGRQELKEGVAWK